MKVGIPSVEEIFEQALRHTPGNRAAYLDEACGGDPGLRQRVERLLKASAEAGSFLEAPAESLAPTVDAPVSERPGTLIGPYKLLQEIGEGGMGVVFLAEQTRPVQRKVALKVIKPGLDSRAVVARFEAERQALALMDHINIARVYDGGTTDSGRPYFVMELVQGVPITQYCDENRLTPRERLELFVPVCQAIQHAHQKGIIHRDLKPSNVMVTLYDGRPVPKVIDFGVAKATEQKLTERTLFTNFGTMVGTLQYMSPEQAEMSALGVDTRSDIYSLGVLLYQLLTGSTPLTRQRLQDAAQAEVLRIIKEEEPPKPSTRLNESGEELATISAQRKMDPAKLTRLIKGELDWIVMKALDKDRNRRYETANGFAVDVQRYLADEPVAAGPPSTGYRLRKFVRRHRGPVLAISLVLTALIAGVIGTTWNMMLAQRARENSQKRLDQLEKATETLATVFRDVDPKTEASEGVTLRVLLGRRLANAADQIEGEAVGDPLVVARLQHLLGISLRELGHPQQAESVLVKARQTRQTHLGVDHLETASTNHNLAGVYRDLGKTSLAETLYKEVIQARSTQLGPDHADTLSTKNNLALLHMDQRQLGPAEELLEEVLAARLAKLGPDDPKTLQSRHNLTGLYDLQGKKQQAAVMAKEVLAIRNSKLGPYHLDTLQSKHLLAGLYMQMESNDLAESLFKEALQDSIKEFGPNHALTLTIKNNLAVLYSGQERHELVALLFKEILDSQSTRLPYAHPSLLITRQNLARTNARLKRFEQAIPMLEETVKLEKGIYRDDHPELLDTLISLGKSYLEAGRVADAIKPLEEAHQKARTYPRLSNAGNTLLTAYALAGRKTDMTKLTEALKQAARKQYPEGDPKLIAALGNIGKALLEGKAYAEAEPLLREYVVIADRTKPAAWSTHQARSLLGGVLWGQRQYSQAEPLLLQGYQGMKQLAAEKDPDARPSHLVEAIERLVQQYESTNKPEEAAKWRRELASRKEPATATHPSPK